MDLNNFKSVKCKVLEELLVSLLGEKKTLANMKDDQKYIFWVTKSFFSFVR